ncbi:response regulator [Mesorhizobium sp. M0621]|uniref:response regulator n=1 Tax=Mesorhizobium sp. M0621 TaxID=2956974 RepID=UPI00333B3ED2
MAAHILLVEDDQFKQEPIESAIREVHADPVVHLARSVQQAVKLLRSRPYDCIVLDIALPSHESRAGGAQPISQPSGGIEVLLELAYDARNDPVIIVTQYPEIEYNSRFHSLAKARQALRAAIPVNIVDVVQFNAQDDAWRGQLRKALACGR